MLAWVCSRIVLLVVTWTFYVQWHAILQRLQQVRIIYYHSLETSFPPSKFANKFFFIILFCFPSPFNFSKATAPAGKKYFLPYIFGTSFALANFKTNWYHSFISPSEFVGGGGAPVVATEGNLKYEQ